MDDNEPKKSESALAYGLKSAAVVIIITVIVVTAFVLGLSKLL